MMTTHLRRSTRLRTATLAVATLGLVYSAHLTSPPALMAQEDDAVALFKKGVELFRQERYVEARDVFRRVFELDPNPFVIFNIGRCYEELGELEEAVRYYDRSLKLEGLPEQAKVEAIKRIENLEPLIQAIKTRRTAVAEAAIRVDRSFYVAQNDARKSNPLTQPVPAESRTAVTWIGVGTASLGLLALGAGFVI
ncbi:MAG: tetratricopeptide repeat protein, partial [Myxococcota bacterium]